MTTLEKISAIDDTLEDSISWDISYAYEALKQASKQIMLCANSTDEKIIEIKERNQKLKKLLETFINEQIYA